MIWPDRGWSNNKGFNANYKCSILVQWHETSRSELDVTSLPWYLISGSKFLLENCIKIRPFPGSVIIILRFSQNKFKCLCMRILAYHFIFKARNIPSCLSGDIICFESWTWRAGIYYLVCVICQNMQNYTHLVMNELPGNVARSWEAYGKRWTWNVHLYKAPLLKAWGRSAYNVNM